MAQLDEKTSAHVASIAGRGLENPGSLSHDEIKAVCASALVQTGKHTSAQKTKADQVLTEAVKPKPPLGSLGVKLS